MAGDKNRSIGIYMQPGVGIEPAEVLEVLEKPSLVQGALSS
jgi:hypothetical protein